MPWASMDPAKFYAVAVPLFLLLLVGATAIAEAIQERRK